MLPQGSENRSRFHPTFLLLKLPATVWARVGEGFEEELLWLDKILGSGSLWIVKGDVAEVWKKGSIPVTAVQNVHVDAIIQIALQRCLHPLLKCSRVPQPSLTLWAAECCQTICKLGDTGNPYLLHVSVVSPRVPLTVRIFCLTLADVSTCWLVISPNLVSLVALLKGYPSCSLTTPKN